MGVSVSRFERARDAVRISSVAAWHASQIVAETKSLALHRGLGPNAGPWELAHAPDGHSGSQPRKIDVIAHRAMRDAITEYDEDAVILSEESDETWSAAPESRVFTVDPEDGTDCARAIFLGDASVVLAQEVTAGGHLRFVGGAIAAGDQLLSYTVFAPTVIEAQLQTPPRGAQPVAHLPTSRLDLVSSIDRVVPGDPTVIAVAGAQVRHRRLNSVRALLSPDTPGAVWNLSGAPLAVPLLRGGLGALVSPRPQKLRDAAHLPLVAGLPGGIVRDLAGQPLPVFELFNSQAQIPAHIAASSQEALDNVLAQLAEERRLPESGSDQRDEPADSGEFEGRRAA